MASATITERIKKLLRLAADKRGNAHEAERALQLAFELAEKHRVDVESLNLDEESTRLVEERWRVGGRFDRLRRGVFSLLQTYFHVTVCLSTPEMIVIGRPQDVTIARYVHDFLLRTGRNCLRVWEATEKAGYRRVTMNKRANYIAGFIYGLSRKLHGAQAALPLTDNQRAIVVAEDAQRQAKLAEIVPPKSLGTVPQLTEQRRNRNALAAGFADGQATQINQPLGATGGTLLLQ